MTHHQHRTTMPKLPLSPEAAQKRVWKSELKNLQNNRRKVVADFDSHQRALIREAEAANKKLTRFISDRAKREPKALRDFDARIAVLEGRLGL